MPWPSSFSKGTVLHVDWLVSLASIVAGFTVGLTGMGGGALMTPMLVLLFHVEPLAAVSSDLVAALVMKPVGGAVHMRRGTVNWDLVRWLCIGSIPTAFAGVFVLRALGDPDQVQVRLKAILGAFLLIAASALVLKAYLHHRHAIKVRAGLIEPHDPEAPLEIKKGATLAIGAAGGLMVGMTSVGSGSLIIILLMMLYPRLHGRNLVGTDLVQAIPLVAAAAVAHVAYGDFQLGLTASVLIGAVPGVYLGAAMSSRAPDAFIRICLVYVLMASGLKLVGLPTETLFWVLLVSAVVGLPIWGAIDAHGRPDHHWVTTTLTKKTSVRWQAYGAFVGVGFGAALHYFFSTRKHLKAAEEAANAAAETQQQPVPAPVPPGSK